MKTEVNLLLAVCLCSCVLLAQQCKNIPKKQVSTKAVVVEVYQPFEKFKNDSLDYLKTNFVNRKAVYLNQTLDELFQDFEMPVKNYVNVGGDPLNLEKITGVNLMFDSQASAYFKLTKNQAPNTLYISLKKSINQTEVAALGRKYKGKWSDEVKDFYSKLIVENISTMKEPKSKN